jgi:hypothetical protein
MVRQHVWSQAFPDYPHIKRQVVAQHKGTKDDALKHVELCFDCLESRLGRRLEEDDFDLTVPINWSLAKGMEIARRTNNKEAR